MISYQFDLFDPPLTETDILRKELQALKDSQDRQRKNLFAKHGELSKLWLNQEDKLDKQAEEIRKLKKELETLRELMMSLIK